LSFQEFSFVNGKSSARKSITTGVPQGSVLGPILFLIYVNDLPDISDFLTLLFADDTTLLISHSNFEVLCQMINIELHKVVTFFRQHKLALHPQKTKYMVFSNSQVVLQREIEIFINFNNSNENDPTKLFPLSRAGISEESPAVRFLGVYFDPNLNYKYHIKQVLSKLSRALYMLRASKNLLSTRAKKNYILFLISLPFSLLLANLVVHI